MVNEMISNNMDNVGETLTIQYDRATGRKVLKKTKNAIVEDNKTIQEKINKILRGK